MSDRMQKSLGVKKNHLFKCVRCRAMSSKDMCPDKHCMGPMELVLPRPQF